MNNKASKLYNGFFSRILKKRPFITLKIACSLDGKIALKNNKSKWITNELSRSYVHFLRSQNDAIMTSSNTILKDNPRMDCRLNGLEKRSPTKIILDRYLKIPSNYNIYNVNTYISANVHVHIPLYLCTRIHIYIYTKEYIHIYI